MAVTRSTAEDRARRGAGPAAGPADRSVEFTALLAATLLAAAALFLVYSAKARVLAGYPNTLDLARLEREQQLYPVLQPLIANPVERQFVAREIFDSVRDRGGSLPNAGTLARIRLPVQEIPAALRTGAYRDRITRQTPRDGGLTVPLLTRAQFAALKPRLAVRSPGRFRWALLLWSGAFVLVFYAAHLFWTIRGFKGSQAVLPGVFLLTGIGLALMLSLRDPLRDTLAFAEFSQGVILGVVLLAAAGLVDYERFAGFSYVPMLAACFLSVLLILFGSGPGTSDAKVNLLGFQPVEVIKILLVFFFAGYFARRWELLRTLEERRPELTRLSRYVKVPRLEYLMPVVLGVAAILLFFFLQRDLGPALVISSLFLLLYAVARGKYLLAAGGFAVLIAGFGAGYALGFPRTVSDRVEMWISPWDNLVRGGDQVVHSLWAFATGGIFGTGLGLGDPDLIPAAHTDLVLAAMGEEWGFAGLLATAAAYVVLAVFGFRAAARARSDYAFFLALGCTLLLALQVLFIAGGALDLIPLSGIVTPFLSYGRSAMLANFVLVGILLSVSRNPGDGSHTEPFRKPVASIARVLAAAALMLLLKAAYVQVLQADPIVGAGALTTQADGVRRYEYNPRLMAVARGIPRGAIYDRNGLPIATSDWTELEKHRAEFARLGIPLPPQAGGEAERYYLLGATAVHLLGDLRTRANWSARNSSLQERDSAVQLQGYDDRARVVAVPDPRTGQPTYTIRYDYRELVPLLRHRWQPDHAAVRRILDRNRNVRVSIDARLQWRGAAILRDQIRKLGKERGALVVLDPADGDLLASVSYPWPAAMPPTLTAPESDEALFDRPRYGIYPPGSTFKVVTAVAALRRDPENAQKQFECRRLPDGRVGNYVRGWRRPVRDDVADRNPHGSVAMERGMVVSCNAYFAQLAAYQVGPQALLETAKLFGISVANPNTPAKLKEALAQAGYGQGQVVTTPLQMARVAATVANGGMTPYGRWVIDESNPRVQPPQRVLSPQIAGLLGQYMREVVTRGTGRNASSAAEPVAGKTGTAELGDKPAHAWFIGYAPASGPKKIAFAILIEHGQYGGTSAAPVATQVVNVARELGLLERTE
ncbi:MAG: FtsW/RodA/SpoVE family cell cycle protein [Acidobacteria bacterium]|nr:FtsW/RodA/SpoVE family cell cycle protein [Acidobacteriota bacterium]